MYAGVPFSIKLQVAGGKKTLMPVCYCEFSVIFKINYLAEHVRTAASDIFGYPYLRQVPH